MAAFPHLMSEGRIGSLALRNRILMCPMGDSLCETDGSISENQAAYFEARAAGGAALLLVGSVSIAYPRASFDERQVAGSDDRYLTGLMDLTERVHRHGGRIAAQLVHNGQMSLLDTANGLPMLVPSVPKPPNPDRWSMMVTAEEQAAMMSPYTQPTSKLEYQVMDEGDIATVIEQFVDCAERCVRAGFDGIEIHAGHGYLVDEFLTPSMNVRSDGWGGSLEGRARLLIDVLRAIRARVGRELPLWIRINAVEHHKADGEVFADQLQVIEMAVAEGIDAVHVTAYGSTDVATTPTDGYAPHTYEAGRPGSLVEYARAVRAAVDVPVIAMGRMEPDDAEQALASGAADFIAMGRKLLADPELPNKLAAGDVADVRPCIYQYRCIGNIFVKESLHCVANARTGREHDLAVVAAVVPRSVLVVGGGPAGLETARVLAERGHQVTLWEGGAKLGGMLGVAGLADPLLERYRTWLIRQVDAAGVDVELKRRADAAAVVAAGFDHVVVATGAVWGRPEVPGAGGSNVLTVPEVEPWLRGGDEMVGERVVVLGGSKAGLSLASRLRERGRTVTLVEPTAVFGAELGLPGRWRLVADLHAAGVELMESTAPVEIGDGVVVVERSGEREELGADTVISALGVIPDRVLADALAANGDGVTVHTAGDCGGIRRIEGANLDAAAVALALS